MPTNELLPFATAGGAGVMSQSDYAALAARLAGFVDGIAEPAEVNKVWRQAAFAAAMIGQFTADKSGQDTLDNGDVATFQANFTAAIKSISGVAFRGAALFTSSGTFDPSGLGLTALDRILVLCWGAGGGGASTTGTRGASGAGGGLAIKSMNCPASSVTVTIGAGGAGNNAGSAGATGGTSSFGAHCSATGGVGGSSGAGAGGTGTGGSINLSGSAGCDILSPEQDWGPGGAAPFMGPGMLNNGGANPIGSGGAASAGAPQADAGAAGAVIVFY